jgi:hypothetical protein
VEIMSYKEAVESPRETVKNTKKMVKRPMGIEKLISSNDMKEKIEEEDTGMNQTDETEDDANEIDEVDE